MKKYVMKQMKNMQKSSAGGAALKAPKIETVSNQYANLGSDEIEAEGLRSRITPTTPATMNKMQNFHQSCEPPVSENVILCS